MTNVDTNGAERPVSRVELLDQLGRAMDARPFTKHDLVEAAAGAGARQGVVDLLHELPDRRYHHPRDLWSELPDVPVEAEPFR